MRILVTSAAGRTGLAVINALKNKNEGICIRAFVVKALDAEKAKTVGADEAAIGDVHCKEDVAAAMEDVDLVYHICPVGDPQEAEVGKNLIQASIDANVKRFIYHSSIMTGVCKVPQFMEKQEVETALVASGLTYTILRPAIYMQSLSLNAAKLLAGEKLRQKYYINDETRVNFVDLKEVAKAAANVIDSEDYDNATFELCGPKNITLPELRFAVELELHKNVEVSFITDSEFCEVEGDSKISPEKTKGLLEIYEYINRHGIKGNDRTLCMLLGKPRTTDFVAFAKHSLRK